MSRMYKSNAVWLLGVVCVLGGCDTLSFFGETLTADQRFVAVDVAEIGGMDGLSAKAGVVESEVMTVSMPEDVLADTPDDVSLTLRAENITVVVNDDTSARRNPSALGQEHHASITFRVTERDSNACEALETIGPFALTIVDGVATLERESFPLNTRARSVVRSGRFEICTETSADFDGSITLGGVSFEFGQLSSDEERVVLCHIPPEDEGDAQTITVGSSSVDAHLAHDDYLGECDEPADGNDETDGSTGDGAPTDTDGDGVADDTDVCPETLAGETVDASGCSCSQRDGDDDGVDDCRDACPQTGSVDAVDASGCAEADNNDDDDDGVSNGTDVCPDTLAGEAVDAIGCACSQRDGDADGVNDCDDGCPNSESAIVVDETGCADSDLDDDDGDGVINGSDTCANTTAGSSVDANGCATNQIDDDNDGVMNDVDACTSTQAGTNVGAYGCVPLAANAGSDATIAFDGTTTLGGSPAASGGDGSYTYSWSPITGLNDAAVANPVFTASTADTTAFTLTATDGHGASASDGISITVLPLLEADAGADSTINIGKTATLGGSSPATGGDGNYTYSWSPTTDLNDATTAKPVFTASSEGDYVFTLTVTDSQATTATDSVTVTVVDPCGSNLKSVDKTITVGNFPRYLAVLPNSGSVYATNFSDDTLSVIQTSDHAVTTTVSVGNGPNGIVVTPDGANLYVANSFDDTLSVVRTSDHTVISTFSVGNEPNVLAISPDGTYIYAPLNNRKVAVVRTSDSTVVTIITVGDRPWGVAISPDGSHVYVCNNFDNTVSVIQTSDHTVIDTVSVGNGPLEAAVSPNGDYVYVTNFNADTVSIISTTDHSVTATLPVGDGPWDIVVSPDGCYVYIVNYFAGSMSVVRTRDQSVVDTVSVGQFPKAVVVSPNGNHVYSANEQSRTVRAIGP